MDCYKKTHAVVIYRFNATTTTKSLCKGKICIIILTSRDVNKFALAQQLKQNSAKSGVLLILWETFENAKQFNHVKEVFASLTYKKNETTSHNWHVLKWGLKKIFKDLRTASLQLRQQREIRSMHNGKYRKISWWIWNIKPEKQRSQKNHKKFQEDTLFYKCFSQKLLQLLQRYTCAHFHGNLIKGSKRKSKQTNNIKKPQTFVLIQSEKCWWIISAINRHIALKKEKKK